METQDGSLKTRSFTNQELASNTNLHLTLKSAYDNLQRETNKQAIPGAKDGRYHILQLAPKGTGWHKEAKLAGKGP